MKEGEDVNKLKSLGLIARIVQCNWIKWSFKINLFMEGRKWKRECNWLFLFELINPYNYCNNVWLFFNASISWREVIFIIWGFCFVLGMNIEFGARHATEHNRFENRRSSHNYLITLLSNSLPWAGRGTCVEPPSEIIPQSHVIPPFKANLNFKFHCVNLSKFPSLLCNSSVLSAGVRLMCRQGAN